MSTKITKIMIIEQSGRRVCLRPDKIVDDVEKYRRELKDNSNAAMVLFNHEEISYGEWKQAFFPAISNCRNQHEGKHE